VNRGRSVRRFPAAAPAARSRPPILPRHHPYARGQHGPIRTWRPRLGEPTRVPGRPAGPRSRSPGLPRVAGDRRRPRGLVDRAARRPRARPPRGQTAPYGARRRPWRARQ